MGIVLADVDGLKATNDARGHDAGDRLLVTIAKTILEATPAEGGAIAARLGGDEFGILLPGALAGRAEAIARTLRRSLGGTPGTPSSTPVSASIGYGLARNGAALALASREADRRVYDEKARKDVGRRTPASAISRTTEQRGPAPEQVRQGRSTASSRFVV